MKKLLLCCAFALLSAAIVNPIARADTLFTKDLYFGIQGDSDVTKLQEFLTDQNVYSGPITGNFFSLTFAGVKSFQAREGIVPVAGYFGPLTRAKANEILSGQIQASNDQALAETSSTPPIPTLPATTNDVNNSLQAQLNLLLQQIALLQAQLQTQQSSTQAIQNLSGQVAQQWQTLQQIQQNTTPPPPSASSSSSICCTGSTTTFSPLFNP